MAAASVRPGSDAPIEQLMLLVDTSISRRERSVAMQEPPWDGYCGLVKICDDESFKTLEQGFIGKPRPTPAASAAIAVNLDDSRPGPSGGAEAGEIQQRLTAMSAACSGIAESRHAEDRGDDVHFSTPSTVSTSISDARRTVAASLTGAGNRVVSSLQAAAEEASRLLRTKSEEDLTTRGAMSASALWRPWSSPGMRQRSLADRLGTELLEALQAAASEDLPPDEQAAAAKRASIVANEAFKAAMAAIEAGRAQEAKLLAEVALRGVPPSKPRALAKLHALRARAEAQVKAEASRQPARPVPMPLLPQGDGATGGRSDRGPAG